MTISFNPPPLLSHRTTSPTPAPAPAPAPVPVLVPTTIPTPLLARHPASGYTLPLALLAMLVTLAMLRGFHDRALSLVQQWRIGQDADAVEEAATQAAVSAPLTPGRCSSVMLRSPQGSTERLLCHESLSLLLSFPATELPFGKIDYGSIFGAALPCPGALRTVTRTIFDSPTARQNCVVGLAAAAPLVVLENISGGDLRIESPNQEPFSLVATPGSFELRGALLVDGDTLVVAGGNIALGALVAQKPSAVTLLSARGTISVQQVSGGASLVLLGTKELRAPATTLAASPPLPPFRPPRLTAAYTLDGSGK